MRSAFPASGSLIKGAPLLELVRWLQKTRGRAGVVALVERMPHPWRDLLDPSRENLGLLVGSWYPAEVINALYDALTSGLGASERTQLASAIGAVITDGLISGIYRVLFNLIVTPQRYTANIPRMWRQNWSDGEVNARMLGPGEVQTVVGGWKGHAPFNCEVTHFCARQIFERMGVAELRSTWSCRSVAGGDACVATYRFATR